MRNARQWSGRLLALLVAGALAGACGANLIDDSTAGADDDDLAFAGNNLLQNGDFESGVLSPWQKSGTARVTERAAKFGSYGARIFDGSISQRVAASDQRCHLILKTRNRSATGLKAQVKLKCMRPGVVLGQTKTRLSASSDWHKDEAWVTCPTGTTYGLVVISTCDHIDVDNVRLVAVDVAVDVGSDAGPTQPDGASSSDAASSGVDALRVDAAPEVGALPRYGVSLGYTTLTRARS